VARVSLHVIAGLNDFGQTDIAVMRWVVIDELPVLVLPR